MLEALRIYTLTDGQHLPHTLHVHYADGCWSAMCAVEWEPRCCHGRNECLHLLNAECTAKHDSTPACNRLQKNVHHIWRLESSSVGAGNDVNEFCQGVCRQLVPKHGGHTQNLAVAALARSLQMPSPTLKNLLKTMSG